MKKALNFIRRTYCVLDDSFKIILSTSDVMKVLEYESANNNGTVFHFIREDVYFNPMNYEKYGIYTIGSYPYGYYDSFSDAINAIKDTLYPERLVYGT